MECPSCGEEIEDGSQFCRFCGEDLAVLPDDVDIKQKLQSMDDYEFEHFVADLWETMGWDCEVSTASNDKGIDVRAKKTAPYDQKALIQAKRYSKGNKVGSPAIQQYSSLKHQEDNVDKVVVVTTSSYSRNAKELADDLNVKLIDGGDLVVLVDQEDAEELIAEYVDFEPESPGEDVPEVADDSALAQTPSERSTAPSGLETASTPSRTVSGDVQLPETFWLKGAIGCTIGIWIVGLGMDTFPASIIDPLLFITWIGLPVCLYKDSQATLDVAKWPQQRKLYVGIAAVPALGLFVGPLYLAVRYAVQKGFISVERNTSRSTSSETGPDPSQAGASTSISDPAAKFDIDHYTDAIDHVKQLKREGEHDAAEELLLWCIDQAVAEAKANNYSTPPKWYYEQLGIIYRKDGRYVDERMLLERYMEICEHLGGEPREELASRLDRARQLAAQ